MLNMVLSMTLSCSQSQKIILFLLFSQNQSFYKLFDYLAFTIKNIAFSRHNHVKIDSQNQAFLKYKREIVSYNFSKKNSRKIVYITHSLFIYFRYSSFTHVRARARTHAQIFKITFMEFMQAAIK